MDKELISFQMVTCTLENTKKESLMVKASILGGMVVFLLENSKMA